MGLDLKIENIDNNLQNAKWPILISGPCSAESEQQMLSTAIQLAETGKVSYFRAGLWKPRTRPGAFEGVGAKGLEWLKKVREVTGLKISTEVARAEHVELCLEAGLDMIWIGARTSTNPFSIQEVADALRGTDITVLVKNPLNPDFQLWIGALERINRAGVKKLGAIHRGFSNYDEKVFRNSPMWDIPIELKRQCPQIPIITDPSHITGKRELVPFISQKALDLNMDGLMIESHITPDIAWSDNAQQVTPAVLAQIIKELVLRKHEGDNPAFKTQLEKLRLEIDQYDNDIIKIISARMNVAAKIGQYKRDNEVTILQMNRWEQILNQRVALGEAMGLSNSFMKRMLQLVHQESIRIQTDIMNA